MIQVLSEEVYIGRLSTSAHLLGHRAAACHVAPARSRTFFRFRRFRSGQNGLRPAECAEPIGSHSASHSARKCHDAAGAPGECE